MSKKELRKEGGLNLRIAQVMMAIASISAFAAGLGAFSNVSSASDATMIVEVWRLVGFFTFAGLFGFLAAKPKTESAVWLIVLLNKVILTVIGVSLLVSGREIVGLSDVLIFDGGLSVVVLIAFVLSRK